jgi:hypothetical protein
MHMAKFSSSKWFASKGENPTVAVTVPLTDGEGSFKLRLKGQLAAGTAAAAAELAGNQVDKVKVSMPKMVTDGGITMTPSKAFSGTEVSELISDTEAYFVGSGE